jgi:argininosuccinate lyase
MSRKTAARLWGGRFAGGPSEIMQRINASIDVDRRMYLQDIAGSRAHCAMLVSARILSRADGGKIQKGLEQVEREITAGAFRFSLELEDIHTHVESRLKELIGAPAGRLHTARSRNDQVALDVRLWVRDALDRLDDDLVAYIEALLDRAAEHHDWVMPGFTHLQSAQPVTFGHHLMAYVAMAERDRGRVADCRARVNESPLGAAALAGTSFPIDRHMTAKALGFDRPLANSLDAVSARDFCVEYLAAASIIAMHLSRFAEEIVVWMSGQFGFIRLSDAFTTGSSIMPQKRNPDAAELVRAKTGRVFGALQGTLTMLKGLPLTYGKDMQEDKAPLFEVADTLQLCLAAMTGMVRDMQPQREKLAAAAGMGFSTATDLADWLVRTLNLPFRDAHHITGKLVALAEQRGVGLEALPLAEMRKVERRIDQSVFDVLGIENSVNSRISYGGTAPKEVRRQIAAARRRLK